ncbi:unannotated protein [freshwater metagenome]|uniref:Unannotated protein n=1 Tax=freshwater metagenome TaxID=449393 RepID=A0A6J7HEN8_9ZZZZ|nr:nitrate reductase molybdenum cofactor assembly chaperone [Actinomycetota bacterium]
MFRRRSTHSRREDAARTWAVCSVLLDYPTEELVSSLDELEALVADDPHLVPLIDHMRGRTLAELQQDYVATFDHTRKCALYLTYFAYGDTRRRGAALVAFKEAYRRGGVEWSEEHGELPDHLCAVLQFGATVDVAIARQLLEDHRAGVEMLRIALAGWRNDDGSVGSPWAGALVAVSGTLRELAGDEAEAVRRLVEQGPPAEEVGLSGYGADPALSTGPALISTATIPVGAPR